MKVPATKPTFTPADIDNIMISIKEVLESGWLTAGPKVQELEREIARYVGVKHAIAVNNGTAALICVLKALNIQGSTVLVPDCTFAATAHAVKWNGGAVFLADIEDPKTFNVGKSTLERSYIDAGGKVSGVIVVHIGGHPVDIAPIREFCSSHDLFLIEDAAHAHGSEYWGKKCGSLSDAGCFSFYPTKLMTTGEGGIISTDDDELAEKCRSILNQGRRSLYTNDIFTDGANFRMSEINAVIGLTQLKHLDEWIERRRNLARLYNDLLSDVNMVEAPIERKYARSNYYKYVTLVNRRCHLAAEEIRSLLLQKGVSCGMGVYWPPLHRTSFYGKKCQAKDYPISEDVLPRQLCLPMYSSMTEDEVHYVTEQLRQVVS